MDYFDNFALDFALDSNPPTTLPPPLEEGAPGLAFWKAAKNPHKIWFVALLILNTLAILEIIYIFFFSKRKDQGIKTEIK